MCGCRKGNRNTRTTTTTTVRSVSGGISAGPTPTQLRAQAQVPQTQLNEGGLSAERRKTQSLRRDAIRKAFNK